MSFSFRNIFNPEDGESEVAPPQAGGDSRHQSPFSSPEGAGSKPAVPSQTFQVCELLPFIPPAIAAQTGIPMAKDVDIPMSADGSNDVLLSTIYQVCPELFAAEITPLNESTVTLPAKLSSIPEPTPESNSPFMPGAAFSKPPGMAASSATPAQKTSSASTDSEKSNPFWSPAEGEGAPDNKQQTLNDMSDSHSQPRGASNSAESKTPQGLEGFKDPQGKSSSSSPLNSGKPEVKGPEAPGPDAVSHGFSAPTPAGANPFEHKAEPEKENLPEEGEPSPDSQFSGNPFESDEGYSTLFSTQAKEDSEIPFPSPSSKSVTPKEGTLQPGKAPEGTWGTMFDAKAEPESDPDSANIGKGFESIGNLIPGSSAAPASPTPASPTPAGGSAFGSADSDDEDDEDYGLFLPPMNEEHELPAAFQVESPSAEVPEIEEAEAPVEGETSRPSFGFEAVAQSIPQGFSDVKSKSAEESQAPMPAAAPTLSVSVAASAPSEPVTETPVMPAAASPSPAPSNEASVRAQGSAFSESPAPVQRKQPTVSIEPQVEPVPAPVAKADPAPVAEPEPEFEQVAAPAPAATSAAIPGPSRSGEIRDLELRAIFSTSDSFTLRSVARRVVALPGIASCALATPGRLVQASRNEESRIGDEAKEMVQTIRNLAKLTGLPDAQSFTLHTDKGIVSLFLDGECCITVHHETAEFEPGTREKLILISRNLEKLEK